MIKLIRLSVLLSGKCLNSMGTMNRLFYPYLLIFIMLLLSVKITTAQTDTTQSDTVKDYFSLSLDELLNVQIVSASRNQKRLTDAPSVISVVTRDEIQKLAVTTMVDILQYIPSLEVSMGVNGHYRVSIRGTRKNGNILVLINGHHANNFYDGSSIYDFPVTFIERIEVIRGPGSALFGTNAVAGVINIITVKNDKSFTLTAGTNNTHQGAFNYNVSNETTNLDIALAHSITEGANRDPRSDTLSADGRIWTNQATPLGDLTTDRNLEDFVVNATLNHKNLQVDLFGISRNQGSWVGPLFELSPNSIHKTNQYLADVSYSFEPTKNIRITPKIYSDGIIRDYFTQERPAGYTKVNELYLDGAFTREKYGILNNGAEVRADYASKNGIKLTAGSLFEHMSVQNYSIERNYSITQNNYFGHSFDFNSYYGYNGFANHDSVDVGVLGRTRTLFASYVQGEFTNEFAELTLGGRFDQYSDFGMALNPRLGLVVNVADLINNEKWAKGLFVKALYGQAFRAPTFLEMYDVSALSTDGVLGNEDLSPEKSRSTEIAMMYRKAEFNLNVNVFRNNYSNIIGIYDPQGSGGIGNYNNLGTSQNSGIGVESRFRLKRKLGIGFNYSFFYTTFDWDQELVTPAIYEYLYADNERKFIENIPHARINVQLDYTTKKFQAFTGFNYGSESTNNKRSAIENLNPVHIPPYLQFHYSFKYNLNANFSIQFAGNYIGLKFPVWFGRNFDSTSGAIKYSDPDASTNINVLGFNGMAQPGSTNRVSINVRF